MTIFNNLSCARPLRLDADGDWSGLYLQSLIGIYLF